MINTFDFNSITYLELLCFRLDPWGETLGTAGLQLSQEFSSHWSWFLQARCPSCCPTNSVKTPKEVIIDDQQQNKCILSSSSSASTSLSEVSSTSIISTSDVKQVFFTGKFDSDRFTSVAALQKEHQYQLEINDRKNPHQKLSQNLMTNSNIIRHQHSQPTDSPSRSILLLYVNI